MANIPPLGEPPPADTSGASDEEAAFRHEERVQQANLGLIGQVLGSEKEKPGNIAGLVLAALIILVGLLLVGWVIFCMGLQKCAGDNPFLEILASLISIVTLILGYLFGSRK